MNDPFDQLEQDYKPKISRPSIYTEELALRLIDHLNSGRGLRQIAEADYLVSN